VDKIRSIIDIFDKNVDKYDSWYLKNIDLALEEENLVQSFNLDGRGVEIGSGTCYFTKLRRYCIGIDASFTMCKVCKSRYDIDVINSIGEMLPLRDKCLNYVMIIVTICFVDDYERVVKECYRCLKDSSKVLVCIVPRESWIGRKYVEKKITGSSVFYTHARLLTGGELVSLFMRNGFNIVECRSALCVGDDCGFRCFLFVKSA